MKEGYAAQRQFVGVDLARRRSVIARMDPDGGVVDCVQIDNSVEELVAEVAKAAGGGASGGGGDVRVVLGGGRAAAGRA